MRISTRQAQRGLQTQARRVSKRCALTERLTSHHVGWLGEE